MEQQKFEIIGYFKEWFLNGKFIGTTLMTEPEQDVFGYYSQKQETINEDTITSEGKLLKSGLQYKTYQHVLCGKYLQKTW